MGDAAVFELLQDDLQRRDALGIGLADDDGRIAGRQRERAFVLEFDGAGAVDEGEVIAEERHVGDVELKRSFRGSRASGLASPTLDLSGTLPARWMAPVRARMASRSVVLPLR